MLLNAVSKWIELHLGGSLPLVLTVRRRLVEVWWGRRCLLSLMLPFRDREVARAFRHGYIMILTLLVDAGPAFDARVRA